MKFLLILIQSTIASPLFEYRQTSVLQQAVDLTMMNMDVIMVALAVYEQQQLTSDQIETKSIVQAISHHKRFNRYSSRNDSQRTVGKRCFWKTC